MAELAKEVSPRYEEAIDELVDVQDNIWIYTRLIEAVNASNLVMDEVTLVVDVLTRTLECFKNVELELKEVCAQELRNPTPFVTVGGVQVSEHIHDQILEEIADSGDFEVDSPCYLDRVEELTRKLR